MERRSLFKKIFNTDKNVRFGTSMKLLNDFSAVWTTFNGNIYDNQTARACIDTIARNGAKLSPKHIRKSKEKFEEFDNRIKRLIAQRPNELMNAYDFYYKVISQLYLNNNSFIWVERNGDNPINLWPIKAGSYEVVEDEFSNIYIRFTFGVGKTYTASYDDIIHLRRFYCDNDVLGGNNNPIVNSLEFQNTTRDGIKNAIKLTAGIKGVLKTTKAMLKPEDIQANRTKFVEDLINYDVSNGIAGLDATTDFEAINLDPKTATDSQIDSIKKEILEYYGVSNEMLISKYTEEEWNAFYESVLEPIAIQMGLEFTNKLFTQGQRSFGNQILFEANRLAYASNKTKIEVARYMNNYMTQNEIREIFNLAPVEDGDKILQDLNHIDGNIANDYQGGGNTNE